MMLKNLTNCVKYFNHDKSSVVDILLSDISISSDVNSENLYIGYCFNHNKIRFRCLAWRAELISRKIPLVPFTKKVGRSALP